jgi:hypothetical protein
VHFIENVKYYEYLLMAMSVAVPLMSVEKVLKSGLELEFVTLVETLPSIISLKDLGNRLQIHKFRRYAITAIQKLCCNSCKYVAAQKGRAHTYR